MASNRKVQERKAQRTEKREQWWKKFRQDTQKVTQPGEVVRGHFVGAGQQFTRAKGKTA